MSTRSQIDFINIYKYKSIKGKTVISKRRVYRHSDGYPKGVIPDLKKFLKWNKGRNNDVEYQTANFIYWSKRKHEELYFNKDWQTGKVENPKLKWSDNKLTNMSSLHIGFGICDVNEFHGDIAYFYEVITQENKDTIIKCFEVIIKDWNKPIKKGNLKLIKTIKVKGV